MMCIYIYVFLSYVKYKLSLGRLYSRQFFVLVTRSWWDETSENRLAGWMKWGNKNIQSGPHQNLLISTFGTFTSGTSVQNKQPYEARC